MIVVAAIVGYLLGTFPSADLVARVATRGEVDLRQSGSGNPGGLNAMQQIGTAWGVLVIVIDIAKGAVAGFVGMAIAGGGGGFAAADASVAGHIWPVWARFRGGKGVATSAGACLAVFPVFFPFDLAVAALTALSSRNPALVVRVNSAVGILFAIAWWAFDLPNAWGPAPTFALVIFAVVCSSMILVKFQLSERATVAPESA